MLNVVVEFVAQVVTDARGDPLRQIALKQIQNRCAQPEREQNERRAAQRSAVPRPESLVYYMADHAWHRQRNAGECKWRGTGGGGIIKIENLHEIQKEEQRNEAE